MLDRQLRPLKDLLLDPLVRLVGRHVSPNGVTLAAFILGMASALSVYLGAVGLGLAFWIANRTADGLDGAIARYYGLQSDLGGYLDILLDFIVYAAVPAAFVLSPETDGGLMSLILLLSVFYINAASWMYLSAILEKGSREGKNRGEEPGEQKTSVPMPGGLIEGTETLIFYTLFYLFPGRLTILFVLMAFLTVVTIVHRLIWALKNLDR